MNGEPHYGTSNNGQTYFGWGDPIPKRKRAKGPHLFYGVLVGTPTSDLLAHRGQAYCREYRLPRAWLTPAQQMHIRLISLGDGRDKDAIDAACCIGSLIQAKPFDVCFDRLSAFGGGAANRPGPQGQPPGSYADYNRTQSPASIATGSFGTASSNAVPGQMNHGMRGAIAPPASHPDAIKYRA